MRLGIITRGVKVGGSVRFSEDTEHFIDFLDQEGHEGYAIDARDQEQIKESAPGVNIVTGEREEVRLESLSGVFFGLMGQKIRAFGVSNALTDELPYVCPLITKLEPLARAGIPIINPGSSMLAYVSKAYLIELARNPDIPVIPTERITSLDRLVELSRLEETMLAKPLISERSNGTIILNGMTQRELRDYFDEYSATVAPTGDSLYDQVMAQQGILTQPFNRGFVEDGEVKISVVGGEVTLARKHIIEGDITGSPIVAFDRSTGVRMFKYVPSDEEAELALRVFHEVNKRTPAHYVRVDIAGGQVSEVEVLNPNHCTSPSFGLDFDPERVENHYRRILQGFEKR
tara:strand:- start:946 stop:1980 length:1035 start_codon:yes stop_codon:yes gene_type:complete